MMIEAVYFVWMAIEAVYYGCMNSRNSIPVLLISKQILGNG
jgi:hypothetical protein